MSKVNGPIEYYSQYKDCDTFYLIGYNLTQINETTYSWDELCLFKDKYPNIDLKIIKDSIINDIDRQTDEKILNGFKWKNYQVYLSKEHQFNFKAAYDLSAQTNGASLPITFKLGKTPITYKNVGTMSKPNYIEEGGDPIYYTFEDMKDFTDFQISTINYINQCLNDGWKQKDSINWKEYDDLLNPNKFENI